MNYEQNILIVDDTISGRNLLSAILKKESYNIHFATTGKEAIDKCIDIKPDLVLLDIMLPDMDGYKVCSEIRKNPYTSMMPIIMVTALKDKKSMIKALEAGADEFLSKPLDILEVKARIKTILKIDRFRNLLYNRATGLPNEGFFIDYIDNVLINRTLEYRNFSVITAKIKNFKFYNKYIEKVDSNDLISNFVTILENHTKGLQLIAYNGGGIFSIALDSIDKLEIQSIIEKIIEQLKTPLKYMDVEILISCAFGVAIFPENGSTGQEIMQNAIFACTTKHKDISSIRFYDENIREQYNINTEIITELYKAIDREEFVLYFQPQIKCSNREIIGMETLIRWNSSKYGFKTPDFFVSRAEESGAILNLGNWIICKSINYLAKLNKVIKKLPELAINVSPMQFNFTDIEKIIQNYVDTYHIEPENIKIEITESLIIDNPIDVQRRMLRLKEKGFKISIDDFGTGYSSLAYLKNYPADELKIDRAFIKNIDSSNVDLEIVRYIIDLAKILNLNVVAEGVENEKQVAILENLGCDVLQGFYFSKPVSYEEVSDLVQKQPFVSKTLI